MRLPYGIKSYHAAKRGNSDEERERERYLFRVIERHVQGGIAFCIPTSTLKHACALYRVDKYYANPYAIALSGLISIFDGPLKVLGISEPIDLIFDERSEAAEVIAGYDIFKNHFPRGKSLMLRSPPSFKSDEDALPLQAADMIAYYTLQKYRHFGRITQADTWPWKVKRKILIATFQPRRNEVKRLVKQIAIANGPTRTA